MKRIKNINISLTERCNLKCEHCGSLIHRMLEDQAAHIEELNPDDYFSIIKQLKSLHCKGIIYSGGEPFLNTNIWNIFNFTEDNKIPFAILTNGSLLDEDAVLRLKKYKYLEYVRLSLDYINSARFETARSFKDGYKKIIYLLQLMNANNIKIGISMTILKDNIYEIEDILLFSRKYGASFFRGVPVLPIGKYKDEVVSQDFYIECLKAFTDIKIKHDVHYYGTICFSEDIKEAYKRLIFPCPGGTETASISAYGHISICPLTDIDLALPTIKVESLEYILTLLENKKNKHIDNLRSAGESICGSCILFEGCKGGCIAEVSARNNYNKLQPLCLKEVWLGMLENVVVDKGLRRIVNNMVLQKSIIENSESSVACYRALPFWYIRLK